ncbi:RES family NAD+ phosphorylase [Pseudomonas vanderleydeniana]|uniref:RES family NAD+ phosphorylase n=1 Tax=Pseudomonas vanderleydeniana TaxID=2745495 RepID=A0A9E6PQ35_9PSED|nr:RES family NAD+ phosphorylase [Pseudomonas vanderleydeniana]QXI29956.1 RES family NAD+ phosphorylase [Pseudomonas vanderleydeniana]
MVSAADLNVLPGESSIKSYRLVNSKFPPIALFDDVANVDEFDILYQVQALTNPRLQNEVGVITLIALSEIPFGITGCSYATAPFTHVNPDGSRFSDGSFGMLYLADTMDTAIAEVRHHQEAYWSKVQELNYERFVFRGLTCQFDEVGVLDATVLPMTDPIYAPDDYSASRALGRDVKRAKASGLRYRSVRSPGNICWALTTPRHVASITQSSHYEMIWNKKITSVNKLVSST